MCRRGSGYATLQRGLPSNAAALARSLVWTQAVVGCRVAAPGDGWSAVRARPAEPEPDFGAALEYAPVIGELVDDSQTPAAVSASSRTGRERDVCPGRT